MPEERTPAEKVFDRLSSAPIQHPASARLFADWRLQAGDVVTVTSENVEYQVPVYNMEMIWKGSPMVEVDATGSKERPPLPALARRSYGGSQRQAETDETLSGYSSRFERTDSQILGIVEANGIVLGEDGLPLIVDGEYVFSDESNNSVYSQIRQNADDILLEVTRATGAEQTLTGQINVEAGKITQIVTAVGSDGQVNAASIVTAINGQGEGAVNINANRVTISGTATINNTFTVDSSGYLTVTRTAVFGTSNDKQVSINNGKISANNIDIKTSGNLTFIGTGSSETYKLNATNIKGFIKSASVDGDTLTLTPVYGDPITFRKAAAATIQGTWGSGGVYTVSATDGQITPETLTTTVLISGSNNPQSNGDYYYDIYYTDENEEDHKIDGTSFKVTVAVPDVTLSNPTWEHPAPYVGSNSNTYTVRASNGAEKWQILYLARSSSWSNGTRYCYLTHTNTSEDNRLARISFDIPSISESITGSGSSSPYSDTASNVSISGNYHYYRLTVTVGGKSKKIQITQLGGYA